ncbi:CPBP family glutamic-type intramembrane protease [Thalassotalea fusca]
MPFAEQIARQHLVHLLLGRYVYKEVMLNYRGILIKELPFYALLAFITTKIIKASYIFIHNTMVSEQWSYSLVFRNQNVIKNLETLISPIIFAPLFETLIFCVIVFRICKKVKITNYYFILISALLFSSYHLFREGAGWYTLTYTFVVGLILAHCYNKQHKKYGENKAYIFTSIVHSISNGLIAHI